MKNRLKSGFYYNENSVKLSYQKKEFLGRNKNKKLFLFGSGNACDYFLSKYGHKFDIVGIIDNDTTKHDTKYLGIIRKKPINFPIISLEAFSQEYQKSPEDYFIIITNLKYYDEIIEQLKSCEFSNYMTLVDMEYSKYFHGYYKFLNDTYAQYVKIVNRKGITSNIRKARQEYKSYVKEPICKNKIVIYNNKMYNEHTKYIVEYMRINKFPVEFVWITSTITENMPSEIKCVLLTDRKQVMYEMATAKIWLAAYIIHPTFIKRRGQYYINTNHWSSVTLKSFYYDEKHNKTNKQTLYTFKWCGKNMDYMIVGSDFDERTARSGFRTKTANCLHFGSARTDILFTGQNKIPEIRSRIEGLSNQKVILYAPTFRINFNKNEEKVQNLDLDLVCFLDIVQKYYNEQCMILIRLHPNMRELSSNLELPKNAIDVSSYDDIQELILISDMVITDFSSLMFEPMYIKKPVFLYAVDIEDYLANERGLLLDFNELPFSLATNLKELEVNIINFSHKEYGKTIDEFMERLGVNEDGQATKRTAEFIYELMKNG